MEKTDERDKMSYVKSLGGWVNACIDSARSGGEGVLESRGSSNILNESSFA
jgi:hypothetical protein